MDWGKKLELYSYWFNVVGQQTYHDSKMKLTLQIIWLLKTSPHRWKSVCRCNEPFILGGNYVLSILDNNLGNKQKSCSRLIENFEISWWQATYVFPNLFFINPIEVTVWSVKWNNARPSISQVYFVFNPWTQSNLQEIVQRVLRIGKNLPGVSVLGPGEPGARDFFLNPTTVRKA